ncbi:MAG: RHS repeat-associated core domain-containing protein, partial [Bryobacteraceae bacterium]
YTGAAYYQPYGEEETPTGNDTQKFATYTRDSATGLDYAQNRYYASQIGRFTTADPYKASGGPKDPGSWNRYAYVEGDPINGNDPGGLADCMLVDVVGQTIGNMFGCYLNDPADTVAQAQQTLGPGFVTATGVAGLALNISAAISAVVDILTDPDHPDCADAVTGLNDPDEVADVLEGTTVTEANLGMIQLGADGQPLPGGPNLADTIAITPTNPNIITLNSAVNWTNPNSTPAVGIGGLTTYTALTGMAQQVGAASMTAQQFVDLIILHELGHVFTQQHGGTSGVTTQQYNTNIWDNCFN